MNLHIFSILALALAPAIAAGQETMPDPPPDSWSAVVDLAFSAASGNDQTMLLSSGFKVAHLQTERFILEVSGAVRYGRSEGREVARNLKSGAELNVVPGARLSPFVKITGERDPFRKLDLRSGGHIGMKYSLWRSPMGSAQFSVSALYSYESFTNPGGPPLESRENARWSWWFKGTRKLGDRLRLENSTTYEPVWNRSSQFFFSSTSSANVPMSDRIAVFLSHEYAHDSMALPDVKKDDQLLKMGLTLRTKW